MMRHWKIGIGIVLLALAALAQYLFVREASSDPDSLPTPLASSTIPGTGISDLSGGGYSLTPIPISDSEAKPKAPNVDALISGVAPKNDYEKLILKNLTDTRAALKSDADDYDAWLMVGMSFKQLERYEAARDVWIYLSTIWPTQPVPYGNLGSLYHLYLKDFPKSEAAYKKAIELEPVQAGWHRGIYELYRYSYKTSTSAWEDALKKGIAESGSIELRVTLAEQYEKLGRFSEAVSLYDDAIAVAEAYPNTEVLVDRLIGLRAAARAQMK